MKNPNELVGALALGMCALLVACSGGGPRDEDTVPQLRAALAMRGAEAQTIKSKGCRKATDKEIKSSGTYYMCSFEYVMANGKTMKDDDLVFEKVSDQWVFRGK